LGDRRFILVQGGLIVRWVQPILLLSLLAAGAAPAGPLGDLLKERRAERRAAMPSDGAQDELSGAGRMAPAQVPAGVKVTRDLAYGADKAQRLDVYTPQSGTQDAPVIVMVHGGGWKRGDKNMQTVVENKAARWVPRGFVFVSIGYRMLPEADVLAQAADVAHAVAWVQAHAAQWGGDTRQVILMGHSAGAHLAALLTSSPRIVQENGMQPWLGTVALDSAAFDVEAIMRHRHFGLYDEAFGTDPAYWRAVSPITQLAGAAPPLLAVCSSQRADSCDQARAYVQKATGMGNRAEVHPEHLSHREINGQLGLPGTYTDAVERFLKGLAPQVAARLQ
jgi:arylformamidase